MQQVSSPQRRMAPRLLFGHSIPLTLTRTSILLSLDRGQWLLCHDLPCESILLSRFALARLVDSPEESQWPVVNTNASSASATKKTSRDSFWTYAKTTQLAAPAMFPSASSPKGSRATTSMDLDLHRPECT